MANLSPLQKIILVTLALVAAIVIVAATVAVMWLLAHRPTPEQPAAPTAPGPTPTPIIYQFNGQGDDSIAFDSPETGAALIGLAHTGERNFIVELMRNGTMVDLLANTIGAYQGEQTIRLERGSYILNIQADGPWLIVILPPQQYYPAEQ